MITPDGNRAYVLSRSTTNIYVISTVFNSTIDTIPSNLGPFSGGPLSIAMSPDGSRVYTAFVCCEALVIDTFTDKIIKIIPSSGAPPFVGVTLDSAKLYIDAEAGVTIFDTSTFSLITRIEVGLVEGVAFTTLPAVPHSKDDCKDNGFQRFSVLAFRNQGQCIKYVNEHAN